MYDKFCGHYVITFPKLTSFICPSLSIKRRNKHIWIRTWDGNHWRVGEGCIGIIRGRETGTPLLCAQDRKDFRERRRLEKLIVLSI